MKRILTITAATLMAFGVIAQAPEQFSYQAVIRDAQGDLVSNQSVTVNISILEGNSTGGIVFEEEHTIATNDNGLATLVIGDGIITFGNLSGISWGDNAYYLKIDTDPEGGNNFSITATTQLLSVPYALYANEAGSGSGVLEEITEGSNTGYRIVGRDTANYGNIGNTAVDLSYSPLASTINGASGDYSTAMGFRTSASENFSTAMGNFTRASGIGSTTMGYNTTASGQESTAMGTLTRASGTSSTAMGASTIASGNYSTAMGLETEASGNYSIAMGLETEASGRVSTATGDYTVASGDYSTTMGAYTTASGDESTAMGYGTTASGDESTAMGGGTEASGTNSTAMGFNTTASGTVSTAMGSFTTAPSAYETVIGRHNTSYTPLDSVNWNTGDRLFVIGNGSSASSRSDALVVLKNGNVGVGNSDPEGQLFVQQSSSLTAGTDGIYVDYNGDNWKTYHSGVHYSFANMGVRQAYVEDNTGNYVQPSDKNLKTNIETLPSVMDGVLRLNPVSYVYKSSSDPNANTIGFLAQEVGEVFPDVVRYAEDGTPGLAYDLFSILSIKAIQEQQVIIDEQQVHIAEQKQQIKSLIKEINAVKNMLRDIQ
ncbi:MAG: tail fiber domain-containing protein [Bacteroidota bacterium]|nr:tail fiber domain-containing protein [Bacteroidota bacterium]